MAAFVLEAEARRLASELSDLLNCTVCDGIRIRSVITHPGRAQLGYGIDKRDPIPKGIPLTLGAKPATGFLGFSMRLAADDDRRYLMVESSVMGLFTDLDLRNALFHYDYERDKGDGYPEAHLQVVAEPHGWAELCRSSRGDMRPFERLHLPVGGRRYRPTLEDLIEFLINEQIAYSRPGAQRAINEGRERFMEKQLRAAVRRKPDVAVDVLRKHAPQLIRNC